MKPERNFLPVGLSTQQREMISSVPFPSAKGLPLSYDQSRPSYPTEATDSLLKRLQIGGFKGACIVGLAAGTGEFSELLAARAEYYDTLAVEPHDGMRGELKRKPVRSVQILGGPADSMPEVESQSIDAAIAAQVHFDAQ